MQAIPIKKSTLLVAGALAFGCGNSTLQNLIQNNPLFPPGTTRVSVDSGGAEGNDNSFEPTLSADSRFAAFFSFASNLVPNDTNGIEDIFVHDRTTGATTRVSVDSAGVEANGGSSNPSLSADGRFVAFESNASNLVANDTNVRLDIFVHDRQTGETTRVSLGPAGLQSNGNSFDTAISADGRFVAFQSFASNLVANDTNNQADVFVHDRQSGETTRVSLADGGAEANSGSSLGGISADDRLVTFRSDATNLVANDTNNTFDIFVRDRQANTTTRVSLSTAGVEANGSSNDSDISADGRFVAFQSSATNLVANDTNNDNDIFVRDLQTNTTTRVSVDSNGVESLDSAGSPSISADGRFVAFHSEASNLVADDTNGNLDVFVHDRLTGSTTRVSLDSNGAQANESSSNAVISADGLAVIFSSLASNLVPNDNNSSRDIFVNQRQP